MGLFTDLFKSFTDMSKLGKLQTKLIEACNKLDAEGKLPQDIKDAMKGLNDNAEGTKATAAFDKLEAFIKTLEAHEDIFPAELKESISKFDSITGELESISQKVEKQADDLKK